MKEASVVLIFAALILIALVPLKVDARKDTCPAWQSSAGGDPPIGVLVLEMTTSQAHVGLAEAIRLTEEDPLASMIGGPFSYNAGECVAIVIRVDLSARAVEASR